MIRNLNYKTKGATRNAVQWRTDSLNVSVLYCTHSPAHLDTALGHLASQPAGKTENQTKMISDDQKLWFSGSKGPALFLVCLPFQ